MTEDTKDMTTRRNLLMKLGLAAGAAYVAPTLAGLDIARASTGSGRSGGGRASRPSRPSRPRRLSRPSRPSRPGRPGRPSRPSRPSRPRGLRR